MPDTQLSVQEIDITDIISATLHMQGQRNSSCKNRCLH